LNPYKLGLEIWLDLEDRWNKGRYGLDWERCEDHDQKARWDTHEMAGRDMIFRVRRAYNDVTFIDDFLTEDLCHRNQLFIYRWNPQTRKREVATRDFAAVKQQLLRQLANRPVRLHTQKDGKGRIYVAEADQDRIFDTAEIAPTMTG
jgi:stage V sporulation protein R